MIVFNLTCKEAHGFEGWFASAAEFERQLQSAVLSCPICGNTEINKALHAPYVNTSGNVPVPAEGQTEPSPQPAQVKLRQAVEKLVEHVIANTEDVGDCFPEEVRKMHYREAPERQIRGNASHDEVKDLHDEGIEVITLPIPAHRLVKSH